MFKRRWAHRLVTRRGQKFALDKRKALTYRYVKKMYEDVYESLVQAENATKINEFTSDYDGPLKINFHLTHPEMCLVVDEVGSNISQKGDGHIKSSFVRSMQFQEKKHHIQTSTLPY